MLTVEGLRAGYGPIEVLHGVDFTVGDGEIVVILGANGAGKTTTMRSVSGTIPRRGTVRYDGTDISSASPDAIVRSGLAQVPQGRGTFTDLSVEDNLMVGAYVRSGSVKEDIDRWYSTFPILAERRDQLAGTLSGGEQQMLAVGRALMLRPRLMLLDEPSFGLAPLIVQELFAILRDINRESKVSMLLVEQNAALALELADHAYLLETGRVVIAGPAADIREDENVRRSYLGY
jgi:branched-chain amino acid transport system ATP-binding protein